jgi:hypothetical protein
MVSNVKAVWLVVLKVELSRASFSSSKYVNGVKYKLFKKKKKVVFVLGGGKVNRRDSTSLQINFKLVEEQFKL